MKKLADFELPYVSLRSSEVENCKVGLRKWWVSIVTVGIWGCLTIADQNLSVSQPNSSRQSRNFGKVKRKAVKKREERMNKAICPKGWDVEDAFHWSQGNTWGVVSWGWQPWRYGLKNKGCWGGIEAGNGEELWDVDLFWNGLLTINWRNLLIVTSRSDSSVELWCSLKAKGGLSQLRVPVNCKQSAYIPKGFQQ